MKQQEAFDKAATCLLEQGEKSIAEELLDAEGYIEAENVCMYRKVKDGGTVLKCAVGCLISDEDYVPAAENTSARGLEEKFPSMLQHILEKGGVSIGFLSDLQRIHDTWEPAQWKERLREFANKFELSAVVLDKFETPAAG